MQDTAPPPISPAWLERMRPRPHFVRALFEAFLADEPTRLAAMREAAHAGDVERLRYLAHSLKGAAATLGLLPLSEACRVLEFAARDGDAALFSPCCAAIAERLDEVFAAMRREISPG